MKTEAERTWENLPEDELRDIFETSPSRTFRKAAAKELKRRNAGRFVDCQLESDGPSGQVVIAAVNITPMNFLKLFWNALPAIQSRAFRLRLGLRVGE